MRYPERPSSGRSRFGVRRCPPAPPRITRADRSNSVRRPCGFPPGECDAGKLDVRTCRLRFRTLRERAALLRRLNECACNRLVYCRSCGGLPVQPADHSLTSDPSYQAPPLRTFAARHRSCTADCSIPVFRYRFGPSRPGPAMSPSLCSPGNALGVHQRPSQVCSRIGWATISDRPGPRACSSQSLAPIYFRRVLRFLKVEAGAASDWIGFWALTPVCGPCLGAIVRLAARSFLPWALPLAGSAGTF